MLPLTHRSPRAIGQGAVAYKLAIFDFDGTLADSGAWFFGVFNEVAARYRFRQVTEQEIEELRGLSNREIVRALGVPGWKMPLVANHMRKLAARDIAAIRLFPGALHLLRALSAQGVEIAVVSSNSEENVRRILGPDGAALVDHYACGASLFGKARKFRQVLTRSGVSRGEAISIGDETRDIEAANLEGIASGAVTWGYAKPEALKACRPTWLFWSFDEIAPAVAA